MKILLVEPDFPIPPKSKNHKNFLPIGLLKIATYLRDNGSEVLLFRGIPKSIDEEKSLLTFNPNEIWITSLFTYWAIYVKNTVQYFRGLFPKSVIKVGGIYASLFQAEEVKKFTECDEVIQGIIPEVEEYSMTHLPAYDLINNFNNHPIDYQIIHVSRGCKRKCAFCGTWKIEPVFLYKTTIKNEIKFKKIVIYDNNFFMNPRIEDIVNELIELKRQKKIKWIESQSGFDGRILIEKKHLAQMIKKAGFINPRIAWDGHYDQFPIIEEQIKILMEAGYRNSDIYIFMIYNWEIPFEEMEKKRIKCWEWKIQIADCRYRPLNQLYDNFNVRIKGQSIKDYYIHFKTGWTDLTIKQFRTNVRRQNICVRHKFPFYSKILENKKIDKEILKEIKSIQSLEDKIFFLKEKRIDFWLPDK